MRRFYSRFVLFSSLTLILIEPLGTQPSPLKIPEPSGAFTPRKYICRRVSGRLNIDGRLDEKTWQDTDWSETFGDIEGRKKPAPRYQTWVQMLWDDRYLYIGAYLEERDLWATLTDRDSIIFQDNDFEVFIDPDGDSHNYYEIEINALNTVWDLLLIKPYRDGGPPVHGWDIAGLKTAVNLQGTLNDPSDRDKAWTVEMAIPFSALREGIVGTPERPAPGDVWRINFSRVEYWLKSVKGGYEKIKDDGTGQLLPEDNWVWSPQGLINMHYPEMWGYVQFSNRLPGKGRERFINQPEEKIKWALRKIYYRQWRKFQTDGFFADGLEALELAKDKDLKIKNWDFPPVIRTTLTMFEAIYSRKSGERWHIRHDGLVWKSGAEASAKK